MKRKKGFTLVELLVVIAIIAMLLAILMPALSRVRALAMRLICGTNLNGIGKACLTYANENQDSFPVFGGAATVWQTSTSSNFTGGGFTSWYQDASLLTGKNQGMIYVTAATITSSMYLLIKYQDISTGSFVCRASAQKKFDLTLAMPAAPSTVTDVTQVWDFGPCSGAGSSNTNVWQFCSYSYHQPYKVLQSSTINFPLSSSSTAGLAVMADRTPWMTDDYGTLATSSNSTIGPYLLAAGDFDSSTGAIKDKNKLRLANSKAHNQEGQNVLYADGHVNFENGPNVGIEQDNIYTPWTQNAVTSTPNITNDKQGGVMPARSAENTARPQDISDSFLIN